MALTHNITRKWASGGSEVTTTEVVTADAEDNRNISVPDASTDLQVNVNIDVSELKSLFISSDQAITLETNNGTTPTDTIVLAANVPLMWTENDPISNPLSADVTAVFITNASGSAASVNIKVLQDSTP